MSYGRLTASDRNRPQSRIQHMIVLFARVCFGQQRRTTDADFPLYSMLVPGPFAGALQHHCPAFGPECLPQTTWMLGSELATRTASPTETASVHAVAAYACWLDLVVSESTAPS